MINITKDSDLTNLRKPQTQTEKPKEKYYEYSDTKEGMQILHIAEQYWNSLQSFRDNRKRTRNYRMGLQWEDPTLDPDVGDTITESELIKRNGKVPLKQNIIGQIGNSFLGQWRANPSKPMVIARARDRQKESEMMSVALEAVLQANMADDLDADRVNEFIMSGLPIQKATWGYVKEKDRKDIKIKNINPTNIFFNTDLSDIRGNDINFIGERIECTVDDIVATFAVNKQQEEEIRSIYKNFVADDIYNPSSQNSSRFDNTSFLYASEDNKAVLFEIWRLEGRWMKEVHDWIDGTITVTDKEEKELKLQNEQRLEIGLQQGIPEEQIPLMEWKDIFEQVWCVKYLSPYGNILNEMDTPYLHDEHPYIFHAYPLIDGEIWGFLSEFIDQQRYINRLITLWDFVISASAKGVLMMPEDMLPDNMSPEEFSAEFRRFNGVIYYKPNSKHSHIPQQISNNSTNIGIQEMLSLQLKLINDISGVQGAMQGQQAHAGTPASMYALQTQNSSLNVLDKMKHIDSFLQKRNFKIIKLIKQFYDEPRFMSIVGSSYDDEAKWFDPERIKDVEFDTTISKGKDAPAYRMMIDDLLLQLLQGQFIDIKMYLDNSSAPFADKIKEQLQLREQQMQQGQTPSQMPPELMAQLQKGADPRALQMMNINN